MDKIKNIARRGSILLVAVAFFASWMGTIQFVAFASTFFNSEFAHRILLLSSSSPGWSYTDGAGGTTNAQPGSGPDGKNTAEQFNITTNTDNTTTAIKAFTFQYCTAAAGNCKAPGNDGYSGATVADPTDNTDALASSDNALCQTNPGANGVCVRNSDSVAGQTSDLQVVFAGGAGTSEAANGVVGATCTAGILVRSDNGQMCGQPDPASTGGNFIVLWDNSGTWTYSGGWSAAVTNNEDSYTVSAGTATGKDNYITLTNSTGLSGIPSGTPLEIVFFATSTNYITNPGTDAFFVKMADYSDAGATAIMDGGVTVANVMTQSIQITTKVLETMSFSVGITDPYTQAGTHGGCDPLLGASPDFPGGPTNGIALGDPSLEYSLSTNKAADGWSLWRLSTNSAFGGTVYYSGDTLRSTENTVIDPIGTTAKQALFGSNQFGLALDTQYPTYAAGVFTSPAKHTYYDLHPLDASYGTQYQANSSGSNPWPQFGLENMAAQSPYDLGGGNGTAAGGSILAADGAGNGSAGPSFAFASGANAVPQEIATQASNVIECSTGQVRYLADVAGYTAAGIYTTKINFLAAPQY